MYAVEFQTTITNGTIEVPDTYRHQLSGSVRVIILTDASTEDPTRTDSHSTNFITDLLAHPRGLLALRRSSETKSMIDDSTPNFVDSNGAEDL